MEVSGPENGWQIAGIHAVSVQGLPIDLNMLTDGQMVVTLLSHQPELYQYTACWKDGFIESRQLRRALNLLHFIGLLSPTVRPIGTSSKRATRAQKGLST